MCSQRCVPILTWQSFLSLVLQHREQIHVVHLALVAGRGELAVVGGECISLYKMQLTGRLPSLCPLNSRLAAGAQWRTRAKVATRSLSACSGLRTVRFDPSENTLVSSVSCVTRPVAWI